MTDDPSPTKGERPALPHDAFRTWRSGTASGGKPASEPVVVTPTYDDPVRPDRRNVVVAPAVPRPASRRRPSRGHERNPFQAYGERTSSRPYALRLPDAIDLVLRQIAAEQRTHALRIVDRALYDHLAKLGRLPPTTDA